MKSKKKVVRLGAATIIRVLPRRLSFFSKSTGGLVVFFDPLLERIGHVGIVSFSNDTSRVGLERIFWVIPLDSNGSPLCAGIILKNGDAGAADPICVPGGQKTLKMEYCSRGEHLASGSFLRSLGYRSFGKFVERW